MTRLKHKKVKSLAWDKYIQYKFSSLQRLALFVGLLIGIVGVPGALVLSAKSQPIQTKATTDGVVLAAQHSERMRSSSTKTAQTPSSGTSTATTSSANRASAPTTSQPITGPVAASGSIDLPLFIDPNNTANSYVASHPTAAGANVIRRLSQQPVAKWIGGWSSAADISDYVGRAAAARALPVLVAYNIPNRDCGGYSAGGAQTETAYNAWIQQLVQAIGGRPVTVILEPDAISLQTCLDTDQLAARNRELSSAVNALATSGARVYLDAGHSSWLTAQEAANRLRAAGAAQASGFALNVSNFGTTDSNQAYGNQISALIGSKHYVIDTSRNGTGPSADAQWCNPAGRALGAAPTTKTGTTLADAYLWVKTPWESDGSCNGHPAAGQEDWEYALSLAQVAGW